MRKTMACITVLAIMLVGIFTIFNCGGGDTGTNADTSETEIGPEGGTVSDNGGASVYIPAGALSAPTPISVETVLGDDDLQEEMNFYIFDCSGGGVFEPHGQVFDGQVTITLPIDSLRTPGDTLALFNWSDADTAWDQTSFPAIVDPGGMTVSAEVTHFSTYAVDISFPGKDLFDLINQENTPGGQLRNLINNFPVEYYNTSSKRLPKEVGCCFQVKYIQYKMTFFDGVTETILDDDYGTPGTYPRHERITATREGATPGSYTTIEILIHMDHVAPTLRFQLASIVLDVSEGEASVPVSGSFNCTNNFSNSGGRLEFTVDGPGSVSPASMPTTENWQVMFSSSEEGTATVTATLASCMNQTGRVSASKEIRCVKDGNWYAVIEMDFSHSGAGVDWTFDDHVTILAELEIDEEADSAITGIDISGTQEVTVAPESCDLTSVVAPEFTGGYLKGTKTGNVIQFKYAPAPLNFFVMFGLHCERDPDPPFDIMITTYSNMLATIIGNIPFTTQLVEGVPVTGSGSESFGSDPPIEYSYTLSMGK